MDITGPVPMAMGVAEVVEVVGAVRVAVPEVQMTRVENVEQMGQEFFRLIHREMVI
jgi:hypothetical protein